MKTPKRRTLSLRECPCQDSGLIADPNDSVLRRVKILGYDSINRRHYTQQALQQAIGLYEGVKVNIDHTNNPHASRSYRDRFGKLENITVNEDGMFGDLRFNPEHAEAKSVRWFAENMPDALGLSHNATGQGHEEAGTFVVDKIVAVRSVDLVADPATTRGLRESSRPSPLSSRPVPHSRRADDTGETDEMASVERTRIVLERLRQEALEEEQLRQALNTPEGFRTALFHGIEAVKRQLRPRISKEEFKRRLFDLPEPPSERSQEDFKRPLLSQPEPSRISDEEFKRRLFGLPEPPSERSQEDFKRRLLDQPHREEMTPSQREETLIQLLGKDEAKRRLRERRKTEGGVSRDTDNGRGQFAVGEGDANSGGKHSDDRGPCVKNENSKGYHFAHKGWPCKPGGAVPSQARMKGDNDKAEQPPPNTVLGHPAPDKIAQKDGAPAAWPRRLPVPAANDVPRQVQKWRANSGKSLRRQADDVLQRIRDYQNELNYLNKTPLDEWTPKEARNTAIQNAANKLKAAIRDASELRQAMDWLSAHGTAAEKKEVAQAEINAGRLFAGNIPRGFRPLPLMTPEEIERVMDKVRDRVETEMFIARTRVETENARRRKLKKETDEFLLKAGFGIMPVVGDLMLAYELITGKDIFGNQLSNTEYAIAAGVFALPIALVVVGKVAPLLKGIPKGAALTKEMKEALQAVNAAKTEKEALTAAARFTKAAKEADELLKVISNKTCFVAGTPLLTPEGAKPIEQFHVGDLILSRPEGDLHGAVESKRVEKVFVRTAPILRLTVSGRTIGTTGEHPFYVIGKGWRCANELRPGDVLASHNWERGVVEEAAMTAEITTVYNLRVADDHTYFVGCQEWGFSVWVHNADYPVRQTGKGKWGVFWADPERPGQSLLLHEYPNPQQAQEAANAFASGELAPNHFLPSLGDELAAASKLGVKPTKITGPASVRELGKDGRKFKWVLSEEGELLALPVLNDGDVIGGQIVRGNDVIKHSVATNGRPVQSAGNARIQGNKIIINNHSGHFQPSGASLEAAKRKFEALGFEVVIQGRE